MIQARTPSGSPLHVVVVVGVGFFFASLVVWPAIFWAMDKDADFRDARLEKQGYIKQQQPAGQDSPRTVSRQEKGARNGN